MDVALFEQILKATVKSGASDIHIKVGAPCMVREGEDLIPVTDEKMKPADVNVIVQRVLENYAARHGTTLDLDNLNSVNDIDTSFSLAGVGRFRVNVYRQRGSLAITMRAIPTEIPSIDDLMLPEILKEISFEKRGLVLVTGSTGSGKSTTLASMINHVNLSKPRKIVTIEDPIEFLIPDVVSSISQREVGSDTTTFSTALRAALRQDPDIIMVGEMRDRETIEIVLKAAETGHLVFSTVHTSDAVSSIARLLGVFDAADHGAIRLRLADSLKAVISQRLIPRSNEDSRIAAVEVMRVTTSIQERILSADPRGFRDLIEQGESLYKMQTFDQHLTAMYKRNMISLETAMAAATSPTNFRRNLMYDN